MSSIGWKPPEETESDAKLNEIPGLRARVAFMRVVIAVLLCLLLYRVYWLQQTKGVELGQLAAANRESIVTTNAPRGIIVDRDGMPLATNVPSFNVTITPAFLPDTQEERDAIYARLSRLTGVPITNTVEQEALIAQADQELVATYSQLAEIYGADVQETLDTAGVVPQLQRSIEAIVEENSFAPFRPAVITSGIPISTAYEIEQESIFLPGVHVIPEPLREYPSGAFTSHLIGYMGPLPDQSWIDNGYERDDRVGWAGLENYMETALAGTKGERKIENDWTGREVRQIGSAVEPVSGLNLNLTLDLKLQKIAYSILGQYMEANRNSPRTDEITGEKTFPEIEQAVVVAMNPKTGEILAMVNYPTFDNNRFQTEVPVDYYLGLARNEYTPLVNHAVSSTYPPGSTFKLVPAAAALQEGVVSAERYLFDPGSIEIANRFAPNDPGRAQTFVCWNPEGHGPMNMRLGLANSCDVYFYKISGGFDQDGEFVEGLTVDRIDQYGSQFGFGRQQGIELPLEAEGNLPTRAWKRQTQGEPWSTGDDYNLGIGQGYMTATPMQVAQMGAVIANGGTLYRPSIIHHLTDDEGNIVIIDDNENIVARVHRDPDGAVTYTDAAGNPLDPSPVTVRFDADGQPIYQPEILTALDVDRDYIRVVAEGMRMVNQRMSDTEFYTGATYVDWGELEKQGITTAGKTGTSEYCDNIAITNGWCRFEDIVQRRVLPTHAWYVGYAPYDDPEIVVAVFVFNGGEGSAWAAPVACHVMAAYFGAGQYAPLLNQDANGNIINPEVAAEGEEFTPELPDVCQPTAQFGSFVPEVPRLDLPFGETAEAESPAATP